MHFTRKFMSIAMSGAVLLGMVGAASAAQAVATGNVNVRSGPSAQYQRVDTLQRGQLVEVTGCRGGWCYVEKRGADGWVSANYLQQVRPQHQRTVKPSINFSFSFGTPPAAPRQPRPDHGGWNGGHYGYGWNDNDSHWDRDRPRRRDRDRERGWNN